MPYCQRPAHLYRGLYAGVSEIALSAGVTKQYVSHDLRPVLPVPLGFLMPNERRPYWFMRDVVNKLRGQRVLTPLADGDDIEDWEYDYRGPVVSVSTFAEIAHIPTGNVHTLATAWGEPEAADHLRMGTLWREDEVRRVLKEHGYPRKKA